MPSRTGFLALVLTALPTLVFAISVGQKDDFEKGSTAGWLEEGGSPNPPQNVASGGPAGVNDNYLKNDATGAAGPGGRLYMDNQTQWTGNYLAVAINSIEVDFEVSEQNGLNLRLGFEGGESGTRFVTESILVAPDRAWHPAVFDIRNMIRVEGLENVNEVLANVTTLRIMAAKEPSWEGDAVAATLCVDNITASATVVPVERSTWGRLKTLFDR